MEILDKKSILEMDRGAVIELADYGMAKLLDDIMNPNTEAKSTRTLTIIVKLKPNEQRTKVDIEYEHKLGFGKMLPLCTTLHAMADRETGEMILVEATPQIPGQMGFDGGEQERPVQLRVIRTA